MKIAQGNILTQQEIAQKNFQPFHDLNFSSFRKMDFSDYDELFQYLSLIISVCHPLMHTSSWLRRCTNNNNAWVLWLAHLPNQVKGGRLIGLSENICHILYITKISTIGVNRGVLCYSWDSELEQKRELLHQIKVTWSKD